MYTYMVIWCVYIYYGRYVYIDIPYIYRFYRSRVYKPTHIFGGGTTVMFSHYVLKEVLRANGGFTPKQHNKSWDALSPL